MEKKDTIIIIILIVLVIIGTYIIFNPTKTNEPQLPSGLQAKDIQVIHESTEYKVYITLTQELKNNNISTINIEFYGNTSILYRDSVSIENPQDNTIYYSVPTSNIKEDIQSVLITYINSDGKVIGTSIKYV